MPEDTNEVRVTLSAAQELRDELWAIVKHSSDRTAATGVKEAISRYVNALEREQQDQEGSGVGEAGQDGAEMILAERLRQVAFDGEDWTLEHDDSHDQGELVAAAIVYANPPLGSGWAAPDEAPDGWPWEPESYKPKDQISNLVRAGALIAAEIDRLQRHAEADHG